MRPSLRALAFLAALGATPGTVAAMSCRPLTDYVYVQCANGACAVRFRALQMFTRLCERRTIVDSTVDSTLAAFVTRVQAQDAGAGRAWVASLRRPYRSPTYASDALDAAIAFPLPPDGDGSIVAEHERWAALAAREALRWYVSYGAEIALAVVIALGIAWSAWVIIRFARAPRGQVPEPRAAVAFQVGAFLYSLGFAMGTNLPPATLVGGLVVPLLLFELLLLVAMRIKHAFAPAAICCCAASVALAQAPCGGLPTGQAYVRCDTIACRVTPAIVERRKPDCAIGATIDTLSPASRAALRPMLDSLARRGPSLYRVDGVPFAFEQLADGDPSYLTVTSTDSGRPPGRSQLLRRLQDQVAYVNNRANWEREHSPPWESILVIAGAVCVGVGIRRRRAGRPWASWILPPLAIQLAAITTLGVASVAGHALSWAVMLGAVALVVAEVIACAWTLTTRAQRRTAS